MLNRHRVRLLRLDPGRSLDCARVVADSTEKITETDEDNNTLELPVTGDPSCARPPT